MREHVKTSKEHNDNSPAKSDRKDVWVIARLRVQHVERVSATKIEIGGWMTCL